MSQHSVPPSQVRSFRRSWLLLPVALVALGGLLWLGATRGPAAPPPTPGGGSPPAGRPPPTTAPLPAVAATPSDTPAPLPTRPPLTASPLPETTPTAGGVALPPTVSATLPVDAPSFSAAGTLAALQTAQVPARDLYTLTQQIKAQTHNPLPHQTGAPLHAYRLGDSEIFNVGDTAAGSYFTVTALLRDITPHAYWWVAQDDAVDLGALRQSADRFESKIYPGDVAAFGEPPASGPDGDPRINVLNTSLGVTTAGYFSASDMYTHAVNPFSNERKMIYAGEAPGSASYESVLAHEFQHMIHWNVHPNQSLWINEGMSELARTIDGYDVGGDEAAFEAQSNVQLNFWSTPITTTYAHYGAAYLFMDYLYGRFGTDLIRGIMQAPGSDVDAVDQALAAQGRPERFADVFTDWAVTNWLGKAAGDPRYRYPHLQITVPARTRLSLLPAQYTGTLHQQAADYIALSGPALTGSTVSFQGDTTVPLISTAPHSGQALWWSNRGDVSAPNLTRAFDLRAVTRATLSFWAWYDIEDGYDYAYAEVSTDGGQTWAPLPGAGTTTANPNGNNLGHGYTGRSGGGAQPAWIHEQVDLGPYAGKPILLRFQCITDDGVNLQGFAVDDLRIPEIGFQDDAEAPGANGWLAAGFVHVAPVLPERFVVVLITYPAGGAPVVTRMPLDAANRGSLPLHGDPHAVLLVVPLAPTTIQPGHYTVAVH